MAKNTLVIEKNIPLTTTKLGKWPIIDQMVDGDSVVFEDRSEAINFATAMKKRNANASMRKQADGTVRVWRLGPKAPKTPTSAAV